MSAWLITWFSVTSLPFSFRLPADSRLVTFTLESVSPSISAKLKSPGDKGATGVFVGGDGVVPCRRQVVDRIDVHGHGI